MRIIFAEAAFISVPAGLIGYLVGIGASFLALRLFSHMERITLILDPLLFVGALLLSVIIGLGASVYPAFMAARMDPNTALRSL
jgi:putative ABC transport system permease protein